MSIQSLRTLAQGKKTYIVAALTVALGVSQYLGVDVPGCTTVDPIKTILEGAGFATMRAAIGR